MKTFKEWFIENSEYSYIGPEASEAEKAWDYQQEKVDRVLVHLQESFEDFDGDERVLVFMDDIKDILND